VIGEKEKKKKIEMFYAKVSHLDRFSYRDFRERESDFSFKKKIYPFSDSDASFFFSVKEQSIFSDAILAKQHLFSLLNNWCGKW
jgi:hypothetical protein